MQGASFYDDLMDCKKLQVSKRAQLKKHIQLAFKTQTIKQKRIR